MPRCPACRRAFHTPLDNLPEFCPLCGEPLDATPPGDEWVAIARVTNLAEVGFFDDLLARHEVPCHVEASDQYDALGGAWRPTFVLRVMQADVERAIALVDRELAETAGDEPVGEPASTNALRWIALALLAGGLAYGGRTIWAAVAKPPRAANLWETVRAIDQPLLGVDPDGNPRRVLWFDHASQTFVLDEDVSGDGRLDTRRRFSAEGRALAPALP